MAITSADKELKKLKKIFKCIPEDKLATVSGLIEDAAFMVEQLSILREHISANGWSDSYKNGANQFGKKSSPEADAYIKLQKSYQSTVKQLLDLLPDESQENAAAELMSFVNR